MISRRPRRNMLRHLAERLKREAIAASERWQGGNK